MKPFQHARITANAIGGTWRDYVALHTAFDRSKGAYGKMLHRSVLHSDLGIETVLRIMGSVIRLHDGTTVDAAAVGDQHVRDDLGFVPSVEEWVSALVMPTSLKSRMLSSAHRAWRVDPVQAAIHTWGGDEALWKPLATFFHEPALRAGNRCGDLLHMNCFGIFLCEDIFGPVIETTSGRLVATRDFAENLVMGRFGKLPSLAECLDSTPVLPWMLGAGVADGFQERKETCGLVAT